MNRLFSGILLAFLLLSPSHAGDPDSMEVTVAPYMAAQAILTSHYIAAAIKAGMSAEEINKALATIAEQSVIEEFWVTDENGRIAYSNIPAPDFVFATDPESDSQTAPFARLLTGEASVVVQKAQPRELDGQPFKYAGAAGVDSPRIVQVGMSTDSFTGNR